MRRGGAVMAADRHMRRAWGQAGQRSREPRRTDPAIVARMLQRARTTTRTWLRAIAAPEGRRPRWLVLAACALVAVMYFTNQDMGGDPHTPRGDGVYRPVLARGDGHMMYLMARSTALDGDWRFNNDLGQFGDPWNQALGADGRKVIPHPIGPPLVWTPLIW